MIRMSPKIYLKVHSCPEGQVVAACDEELMGRDLKEGKYRLAITKGFYQGELVDAKMVTEVLFSCVTANLVGKRVVEAALEAEFINSDGVIYIEGVPHAQLFRM